MSTIKVPSDWGHSPTQEQNQVVELAKKQDRLRINASAGSAKTSTLVLCAHNLPGKSLYLAFNKNMAEEARSKFPGHVEVRTTHSLAYRDIGVDYEHKLTRPRGEYRNVLGTGSEIARHFKMAAYVLDSETSVSSSAMGLAVKMTVNSFEYSGDKTLSEKHVNYHVISHVLKKKSFDKKEYIRRVLRTANKLWFKRVDKKDDTIITHDTYMKIWQLTEPDLMKGREIIYLDEAQDTNPCLLDVITKQRGGKIILVGDKFQKIYGWRGAVDAMNLVQWDECQLTKSFRFGEQLATVARNVVLNNNMESIISINGFEKKSTEIVDKLPSNIKSGVWYIYRTNAQLLLDALDFIQKGVKVAVCVDVNDFVSKIESALALKRGEKKGVKHIDLIPFSSWGEFVSESKLTKGENNRVVKIIQGGEDARVLELLKNYKPVKNPDIVLITAHKSKGLENEYVVLSNDFEPLTLNEQTSKVEFVSDGERNLLYVALTRAKELLVVNTAIKEILQIRKFPNIFDDLTDPDLNMKDNQE